MPELLELVETTFDPISQSIQYLAEGRGGVFVSLRSWMIETVSRSSISLRIYSVLQALSVRRKLSGGRSASKSPVVMLSCVWPGAEVVADRPAGDVHN